MSEQPYALPIKNIKIDLGGIENMKLLLDRFIPLLKLSDKSITDAKEIVFNKINDPRLKDVCEKEIKRLNDIYTEIAPKPIRLKTKSRLVVGLGTSSVLEVSMRLHHVYGVPYIPSSAIKGILRAYNILKLVNFDIEAYKRMEQNIEKGNFDNKHQEKVGEMFGYKDRKGKLIILDAIPVRCPTIEKDIINVHYKDYYQNKKPPTDDQNPIPISFLTISANTEFYFYFKNPEIYENLKEDLINATYYMGLGAKSSIGYGIFGL